MTDQHTHMPARTAAQERGELLAGSVRLSTRREHRAGDRP